MTDSEPHRTRPRSGLIGPAPRARGLAAWRERWGALGGTTVTSVIVFLAAWELIVDLFHVPRYIIPAPSAVYRQFIFHFPLIWKYTLVTGGETPADD